MHDALEDGTAAAAACGDELAAAGLEEAEVTEVAEDSANAAPAAAVAKPKLVVPSLPLGGIDSAQQLEFVEFGGVVRGLSCSSSIVQQYARRLMCQCDVLCARTGTLQQQSSNGAFSGTI
jgi:hypothetical protein